MSTLTTHLLDTMNGCPAVGMVLSVTGPEGLVAQGVTNADGRCPDLIAGDLPSGRYRIAFEVAAYFRAKGIALPDRPFLDVVAIDFGMTASGGHYHVPLLVAPFAYSTYRGS